MKPSKTAELKEAAKQDFIRSLSDRERMVLPLYLGHRADAWQVLLKDDRPADG